MILRQSQEIEGLSDLTDDFSTLPKSSLLLSNIVKCIRWSRNLTQKEFADLNLIDESFVKEIESDTILSVSPFVAITIAEAMNVTAARLLDALENDLTDVIEENPRSGRDED